MGFMPRVGSEGLLVQAGGAAISDCYENQLLGASVATHNRERTRKRERTRNRDEGIARTLAGSHAKGLYDGLAQKRVVIGRESAC